MNWMSDLIRIRGHAVWTPPLNPTSVVIDAGAHRGEFSAEIHRRFGCRCIAVEANPILASKLHAPPRGQALHAALGPKDGLANFVFRDNPEGGGITAYSSDERNPTATVEVVSLRTLRQRTASSQISLLKLDIEGAEFPVIANTSDEALCEILQITVEFHDFIPQFRDQGLYEAARARLENLGFVTCPMAFRTNGDVLFLNVKKLKIPPAKARAIAILGRWLLKFHS